MIWTPDLDIEKELWEGGLRHVAGLDEAGRGALAGPVAVGAVILPARVTDLLKELRGVRDSKLMTPLARRRLRPAIEGCALCWGVGSASAEEIDRMGIAAAARLAALRALEGMALPPDFLLTDFRLDLPEVDLPQASLVKGDRKCLSIAAASVLAKTWRDEQLNGLDGAFPGYGLARHKGYGTAAHRAAIEQRGYSSAHRRTFTFKARG